MAERERDMKTYVLYNPKAGSGAGKDAAMKLRAVCTEELEFRDITAIESYADFFDRIGPSAKVILAGGDGTLNRFLNDTAEAMLPNPIYYYAVGSGNDFLRDLGLEKGAEPVCIDLYRKKLPLVEAGSAMPDVVGGEAVPSGSGGTDAMTQTPSSADAPAAPTAANVSGGDGIVTEEQVQKGYVWMNEVNNYIFDATYDDIVAYFGVEGQFVKEEYSDHMKANYRYYKWISEDDESHFIYVNFKETVSGVYTVSGFNTSGFSGKEAIARYLDTVKAEAAEAN